MYLYMIALAAYDDFHDLAESTVSQATCNTDYDAMENAWQHIAGMGGWLCTWVFLRFNTTTGENEILDYRR